MQHVTAEEIPTDDPLVAMAREQACRLLDGNSERARHSAGVAARAWTLSAAVSRTEVSVLVAAAWLHDIGYATALQDTGFHPLDGARYLRSTGWDPRICDLVAHHSGSRFVAAVNGQRAGLAEFTFSVDPVTDALTAADQSIGTYGIPLTPHERMRDMLQRHGPNSPNARAHPLRSDYVSAASRRVEQRLAKGLAGDIKAVIPVNQSRDRSPTSLVS